MKVDYRDGILELHTAMYEYFLFSSYISLSLNIMFCLRSGLNIFCLTEAFDKKIDLKINVQ